MLNSYQQYSAMLKDYNASGDHHPCLTEALIKWAEFKNAQSSRDHLNAVMISIQSAVFYFVTDRFGQGIPTKEIPATEVPATSITDESTSRIQVLWMNQRMFIIDLEEQPLQQCCTSDIVPFIPVLT